jgi:phospholipid/cholesterol/gamma-HCH transport system permease protein
VTDQSAEKAAVPTLGQPEPLSVQTANRRAREPRWVAPLTDAGELVGFGLRVIRELPATVRLYPGEVVRQSGLLIRSNALVMLFMMFMLGALIALTATVVFESIGLESYVSAMDAVGLLRGVVEIVFGWVLAAKAGCGIVAELGAMRISEEIDAMEVMGVRSIPYLVGTRVVAAIVVLPSLFVVSLGVLFVSSKLFMVDLLSTVSSGGFWTVLYLMHGPREFFIAVFWGTIVGIVVTVVACFYGYHAEGGPVGVGRATAQAMLVNLVLISLIAMILAQLFYSGEITEGFGN